MYKGVLKNFERYWVAYGGRRALMRSPYLHAAVFLLALTFNTWTKPDWWSDVISVLPNLLGFTLGGFAIFIGFGDEKFRALLAAPEADPDKPTVYVSLCASFVHFILVQILALIYAIVAKSWWFHLAWFDSVRPLIVGLNFVGGALGYGIFLYALSSALAATMHVFRIAAMYERHQQFVQAEDEAG